MCELSLEPTRTPPWNPKKVRSGVISLFAHTLYSRNTTVGQTDSQGSFSEATSNVGVQARVPFGVPLRRGVDSVGHEALVDDTRAVDESAAAVDEADFELRRGPLDEHL